MGPLRQLGDRPPTPTFGHRRRGRSLRRVVAVVLGVWALAGPAWAQGGAPPPAEYKALEREIKGVVEASGVPGAAVSVVGPGGATWSAGFGLADVDAETRVTPATLFRAESVSKTLVALASLRLHQEGRLPLSARLRDLAPEVEFVNRWEDTHPVRVVHLLEHTSGFDDLHLREYAFTRADGTLRDALAVNPAPRVSRWPPGTAMAYNNGGYAIVGHLIERVTGMPFEVYVRDHVLRPLGMTASTFESVDADRMARSYLGPGEEEPMAPRPLLTVPAGGLVTSADDLGRLVRALVDGDRPVVRHDLLDRMVRPQTTDAARAGLAAGYGLGSYTSAGEGFVWHGHAGGTPSATARYAYQPALGVGYAVLMNGSDTDARDQIEAAVQQFLVRGREAPPPPEPDSLGAPALAGYEGLYRQRTSNWALTSGIERMLDVQRVAGDGPSGTLTLTPALFGDAPRTLLFAGGDLFRTPDQAEPTVVFVRRGGEVDGLRTWDAANLRAGTYERVSALQAYALPVIFGLSFVLMLSGLAVGLVRGVAGLLGRRRRDGGVLVRWLPVAAVVALAGAVVSLVAGLVGDPVAALGRPTAASVGFWALTWVFGALSVAALVVSASALLRRPDLGKVSRGYAAALSLACVTVAATLSAWGLLGLRTWVF